MVKFVLFFSHSYMGYEAYIWAASTSYPGVPNKGEGTGIK